MYALADYIKTERINGVEYDMSPANIQHIRIQRRLTMIIGNFLQGKKCEVFAEAEVRLSPIDHLIPDICIVCEPYQIKDTHIEGAPDFVVEVLSPSTRRKDITVKKDTYERFGVKEYRY